MDFSPSPRSADLRERVRHFISTEIEPVEHEVHTRIVAARHSGGDSWTPDPVIEELKAKAREQGLWNLFLPAEHAGRYAAEFGTDGGEGLSNVDYAPLAEAMGRSLLAPLRQGGLHRDGIRLDEHGLREREELEVQRSSPHPRATVVMTMMHVEWMCAQVQVQVQMVMVMFRPTKLFVEVR